MPIVHLAHAGAVSDYQSEYPSFPFEIGSLRFSVNVADKADWLAVTSNVSGPLTTSVPWERRILLMLEPSGYFPPDYVNQFGILVSPHQITGYRGRWYSSHPGHGAFFGIDMSGKRPPLDYAALMSLAVPAKQDAISAVISRKSVLPGHRRRLAFVRLLKDALGDRFHLYGRGIREVADKAEAILPYRYHLVLENTVMPGYWTEKLADAWLGYAFPIVAGAPDLDRWFPSGSYHWIDLAKPAAAVDAILKVMQAGTYETRVGAIRQARDRLMHAERLCHVLARAIAIYPDEAPRLAAAEVIRPAPRPGIFFRAKREVARIWWQADNLLHGI